MQSDFKYDFLVFIGRFQPFHKGHEKVIKDGLKNSKNVIILCGSSYQPRSLRNPWMVAEREVMIRSCFDDAENKRIITAPLMDVAYNDELWIKNVQETVKGLVSSYHAQLHVEPKLGLIGHSKDHTSYYLSLFPQWDSLEVENFKGISSTPIREDLFNNSYDASSMANDLLPQNVNSLLNNFLETDDYINLKNEYHFLKKYKEGWDKAPYPPIFVTADAVVVQSGHILLVERKAFPGKGLYALPGGFVNQNEKLEDACIRELKEETKLKIPLPVLKGSIVKSELFDDPHRSARGRTITNAFHISLTPDKALPKVKGSDDAKHAFWLPLHKLDPSKMFEDHYFIIQKMLGTI